MISELLNVMYYFAKIVKMNKVHRFFIQRSDIFCYYQCSHVNIHLNFEGEFQKPPQNPRVLLQDILDSLSTVSHTISILPFHLVFYCTVHYARIYMKLNVAPVFALGIQYTILCKNNATLSRLGQHSESLTLSLTQSKRKFLHIYPYIRCTNSLYFTPQRDGRLLEQNCDGRSNKPKTFSMNPI